MEYTLKTLDASAVLNDIFLLYGHSCVNLCFLMTLHFGRMLLAINPSAAVFYFYCFSLRQN